MEDKVCEEKHKRIDECLVLHDRRLNNHSERLDKVEQYQNRVEVQIENLCNKIDGLISSMKWTSGLIITSLLGFFIWYIQKL